MGGILFFVIIGAAIFMRATNKPELKRAAIFVQAAAAIVIVIRLVILFISRH